MEKKKRLSIIKLFQYRIYKHYKTSWYLSESVKWSWHFKLEYCEKSNKEFWTSPSRLFVSFSFPFPYVTLPHASPICPKKSNKVLFGQVLLTYMWLNVQTIKDIYLKYAGWHNPFVLTSKTIHNKFYSQLHKIVHIHFKTCSLGVHMKLVATYFFHHFYLASEHIYFLRHVHAGTFISHIPMKAHGH